RGDPQPRARLSRRGLLLALDRPGPGLPGLGRRRYLGHSLDRTQASRGERVDAGTRAVRPGHNGKPIAALILRDVDVVRRADPAHNIAFGMAQGYRSGSGRWRTGYPI